MFYDNNKYVITGIGTVVWDGVNTPDRRDPASVKHSVRVAFPVGSPELAELETLVRNAQAGDAGIAGAQLSGNAWPIKIIGPAEIDPAVNGMTAINPKTTLGAPVVRDNNNAILDSMVYCNLLYPGAKVRVMVHAFTYNTNGNRGVSLSLDCVQIVDGDQSTSPKLAIAGPDTGAAFATAMGGTPPASATPMAPAAGTPAPTPPAAGVPPTPSPAFAAGPATPAPTPPAPAVVPVTPKATGLGYTHASLTLAGWTDEQMRAEGYIN